MRLTLLVMPLVLAALAGCATQSMPLDTLLEVPAERLRWQAPPDAAATLVVARDVGFAGAGTIVRVTVDGRPAGDLQGAERLTLPVPAGRHLVAASVHFAGEVRRPRTVEVTAEPGKRTVVRVGFDDGAAGFSIWQDVATL